MKKASLLAALAWLLTVPLCQAQENKEDTYPDGGGYFQMGMRTTVSLFSDAGFPGMGAGGQFRLSFNKRLNSEWFADIVNTNLDNLGKRVDGHIGWSVMFYPWTHCQKAKPYLLAGHCFDYTKVTPYSSTTENNASMALKRWSSATQVGLGTHVFLTDKADLSFSAQYMIHLGREIHSDIETVNGVKTLHVEEQGKGELGLEGHLLLTASINFNLARLWK